MRDPLCIFFSFVRTLCGMCACTFSILVFLLRSSQSKCCCEEKVIYANTCWWWVATLSLRERSPRAFLQGFFLFLFLLVPTRGHVKDANAWKDTFHLATQWCVRRLSIPFLSTRVPHSLCKAITASSFTRMHCDH